MPPHNFLTDQQMADTLTYVRNAWGNKSDKITPAQIKEYREAHKERLAPWTEAELRK
jgi:mono/diheme cytochrome c family protein